METNVIGGMVPGSEQWRKAMANANRADKDYVPSYMKSMSKTELEKLIKKLRE